MARRFFRAPAKNSLIKHASRVFSADSRAARASPDGPGATRAFAPVSAPWGSGALCRPDLHHEVRPSRVYLVLLKQTSYSTSTGSASRAKSGTARCGTPGHVQNKIRRWRRRAQQRRPNTPGGPIGTFSVGPLLFGPVFGQHHLGNRVRRGPASDAQTLPTGHFYPRPARPQGLYLRLAPLPPAQPRVPAFEAVRFAARRGSHRRSLARSLAV